MLLCTLQSSLLFQQLPSPVSYAAAPVAVAALVAAPVAGPVLSQFQAQDEFGNLAYGHQNINSAKQEHGNTYGKVTKILHLCIQLEIPTVNCNAEDF